MADVDRSTYRGLTARAHVITHFRVAEAFGIAVAECMATGAIPLVYQSELNATWTDIIQRGTFGMGFDSPTSFAERVEQIITDDQLRLRAAKLASQRAQEFGPLVFKRKFLQIIHGLNC